MKTILKFRFLLMILLVGSFMACKKSDQTVGPNYARILEDDASFKHYVANDILNSTLFKIRTSSTLGSNKYQSFISELGNVKSEVALSNVLNKYSLSLSNFQGYLENRIQNNIVIRKNFPQLNEMPGDKESEIYGEAYKNIAVSFLQKVKFKVDKILVNRKKLPFDKSVNPPYNQIQKNEDLNRTWVANNEAEVMQELDLNEDQMVELMANIIVDHVQSADITFGEFYVCLQAAAIGSFGEIKKIFDAAQTASAAAVIQEMVAVGAKWILKNIGWIGAAILIFNFSSCLYMVA